MEITNIMYMYLSMTDHSLSEQITLKPDKSETFL